MSDIPTWANEVFSWLAVAPQIVLTGNIHDLHLSRIGADEGPMPHTTVEVVTERLTASGYKVVLGWNPATGLDVIAEPESSEQSQLLYGEDELSPGRDHTDATRLAEVIVAVTEQPTLRAALLIEGVARLAPRFTDPPLHHVFMVAEHQARNAPRRDLPGEHRQGLYNAVIWLVDAETDLPPWLAGANPVRLVSIPAPGRRERLEIGTELLRNLDGHNRLQPAGQAELAQRLANYTEGLTLHEIEAVIQVALDQGIPVDHVEEAVRFIRAASSESPWRESELRKRLADAAAQLNQAVRGQRRAVQKVADILARAALGLSGAFSASHPTRPKGVLFLAGPTGVGKTELSKKVAEILFGRAEAMIRFDMSEFSSEHSESRLLGAPPGLVGFHAGGELTNAVRRRPFSLVLFDEIEKAHPRILDKFLQILEDGRLTDATGSTVYFTETFIIFTSNLGASAGASSTRQQADRADAYDRAELRVRHAIRERFYDLGRPELLNRIGDNIIVFERTSTNVAAEILDGSLEQVARRVAEQTGTMVTFSDAAVRQLKTLVQQPSRLKFGGRAVGSVVESRVLNPLARRLLTLDAPACIEITGITQDGNGADLEIVTQREEHP